MINFLLKGLIAFPFLMIFISIVIFAFIICMGLVYLVLYTLFSRATNKHNELKNKYNIFTCVSLFLLTLLVQAISVRFVIAIIHFIW